MSRVLVTAVGGGTADEQAAVGLARRRRDAGDEVVYVGVGAAPEQLVAAALQEDVAQIALPSHQGIDAVEGVRKALVVLLEEAGAADIAVLVDDAV